MDINEILIKTAGFLATVLTAFFVGLVYVGFNRMITARVQNRFGPPFYQNILDVVKLYSKETAIQHGVMHHLGPAFMITASVTALLFIPVFRDSTFFANLTFDGDLIFLVYIMVFGQLGMALGAGQTGNPNSAIGVSRGLSQIVGYEIPFVLSLVALMIAYDTTSLHEIMKAQDSIGNYAIFQHPFAFIAAMLAFLGMATYTPFDVPFAPSELASGPPSEFGGKYLAMMMSSGGIFAFAKLVLYTDLFLGGATNVFELLLKAFGIYLFPMLIGIVTPRFRTEHAVRFFWGWPTFFGILGILMVVWNK